MILGDLARIVDCEHRTAPPAPLGEEFGYSIGTPDLRGGRMQLETAKRVSREVFDLWSRRAVPTRGDLILAREAPVGQVAYVDGRRPVCLGQRTVLIQIDTTRAEPRFLHFRLLAPDIQMWMQDRSSGSTVAHLNVADVRQIPLPQLPPVEEQRRIAGVLGAFDDLIDTNRELVARMEVLLSSLFEERGFDSNGGDGVLADVIAVNPFYPKPKGEAPYVDMAALPTRGARVETVSSRGSSGGARFATGDTLLARITPCLENGKTAYVDFLDSGSVGVGSTEFIILRDAVGASSHWPYFLARSERFRSYAIRHMTGTSGRQRCPADAIARYPIDPPDPVELRRFERIAGPLFEAMKQLDNESEQLAATRDELLPLLMSGRVSVDEAWEAVPG